MAGRSVSYAELSKHRKPGDLWFAVKGKVYDVSKYLDHPGGAGVFEEVAGKDATAEFEDAGNSRLAEDGLELYLIGRLEEENRQGVAGKEAKGFGWLLGVALLAVILVWVVWSR